ncbi:MAG: hypothetical protein DLM69_06540, partial [Candidatus Chloroheliales bacterium]
MSSLAASDINSEPISSAENHDLNMPSLSDQSAADAAGSANVERTASSSSLRTRPWRVASPSDEVGSLGATPLRTRPHPPASLANGQSASSAAAAPPRTRLRLPI